MADPRLRIEPADGREPGAGALLARTFVESPSPVLSRLERGQRFRLLRSLLTAATRDAVRHGRTLVALGPDGGGERVLGVLLLMPPGSYPPGPGRRVRMAPAVLRAACVSPRLFPAWRRSIAARDGSLPPSADWWLLHTIGVGPHAQRRGVGSTLLRHGLAAVDQTGQPCYLHTASPAAAALFGRFGFTVDGPPVQAHPDRQQPYLRMVRTGR